MNARGRLGGPCQFPRCSSRRRVERSSPARSVRRPSLGFPQQFYHQFHLQRVIQTVLHPSNTRRQTDIPPLDRLTEIVQLLSAHPSGGSSTDISVLSVDHRILSRPKRKVHRGGTYHLQQDSDGPSGDLGWFNTNRVLHGIPVADDKFQH